MIEPPPDTTIPSRHLGTALFISMLALSSGMFLSCMLALGMTKGLAQVLMPVVATPSTEEGLPSITEILVFLSIVFIGAGAGGLLASILQRRVLFQHLPTPSNWTWKTIQIWCAGVAAILFIGAPLALMIVLTINRFVSTSPCRTGCQSFVGGDNLLLIILSIIGAGVGGAITWYQLATTTRHVVRDSLWIGASAMVWGGSWWYLLSNFQRLF